MGQPVPDEEVYDRAGFDAMLDEQFQGYEDMSLTSGYAESRAEKAKKVGYEEGFEAGVNFGK